jgi:hypothetical protein
LSETILKEEEEMAKNTIKEQEKRMNEEVSS